MRLAGPRLLEDKLKLTGLVPLSMPKVFIEFNSHMKSMLYQRFVFVGCKENENIPKANLKEHLTSEKLLGSRSEERANIASGDQSEVSLNKESGTQNMRKCRIAGMKKRHFILGAVHVNKQNRRGVIVICHGFSYMG